MPNYYEYNDILFATNFVGGAGKDTLPNPGSDSRANVSFSNGAYQIYYMTLGSKMELDNLSYYAVTDREYLELPAGNTPALSFLQEDIIDEVLNPTAIFSVSFSDVALVDFAIGNTSTSNIVIGQTSNVPNGFDGYEISYDGNKGAANITLKHGDVWLNQGSTHVWDICDKGAAAFWTVMHELGHSLGLSHTDNTTFDSQQYSIMSYNPLSGMAPLSTNNEVVPFGLQVMDIAAIQEIYGRNWSTRDGNTSYDISGAFAFTRPNNAFIYTIWDGGGEDTIEVSGYKTAFGATVDLRQGGFSSVGEDAGGAAAADNLAIAFHSIIENAKGANQNDDIVGNAWDNVLFGMDGVDHLYGDGIVYNNDVGYGAASGEHDPENNDPTAAADSSGNDHLYGGGEGDYLYGGKGNDFLLGR